MDDNEISFWTYSDDCAGITGRHNIDESALWGVRLPLVVDGVEVGSVMVDFGYDTNGGWNFVLSPHEGHTIDVMDDPSLASRYEEEWDEEEDE